jgi:hypothetical protein
MNETNKIPFEELVRCAERSVGDAKRKQRNDRHKESSINHVVAFKRV